MGEGPIVLEKATTISILTSIAPTGGEALLAFTSIEQVKNRSENSAFFEMKPIDILQLLMEQNHSVLIINPGGVWGGIPREDVVKILNGIW